MQFILVTTTKCPKCPEVKQYVEKVTNLEGDFIDETDTRFSEIIRNYSVSSAPTMIVFDNDNNEVFRGSEVSEIDDFLIGGY